MGVAVGEETACTYEGLWNIKGRCCFTATGIKWEPECVATSQLSFFIFYCLMCLIGSHLQEPTGFEFGFSIQSYSLWSPVRKCQQSAESAQHWKFWCGPTGRWPEPGLWWVNSPDKTLKKEPGFMMVGIKTPWTRWVVLPTQRRKPVWAEGQRLDKHATVWGGNDLTKWFFL